MGLRARGLVFTGGASVVRRFAGRLNLGAEVTGALARDSDLGRGQLQTQAGGNYSLNDRVSLDFGAIGGRHVASPRLGLLFGLSADF